MAKRSRRPSRALRSPARPAARPLGDATGAVIPGRPPALGLTAAEELRAAELEAEIVAKEQAAAAETRRTRARSRRDEAGYDPGVPLGVRAAHEYAYVARDVRRIALTAGLMLGILLTLHLLVNVLGVFTF